MSNPKQIRIDEYNYPLPDERIAKYPLATRDHSKLLVYRNGKICDEQFSSLPNLLSSDALMVFNNTKVIQARLFFRKETGATIEIFCLDPYLPNDYALNFQQTQHCSWYCLIGNLKKWKEGNLTKQLIIGSETINIIATRTESTTEAHLLRFEWDNPCFTFADLLDAGGELPIPPYLNRKTEEQDKNSYQTTYSKIKGSVAAPTAGLHFTEEIFSQLSKKGIEKTEVTLHVGAGTFKPVKSETIEQHNMHTEFFTVQKTTIEQILHHKGKVVAVGTTSVRTLESLYFLGCMLQNDQNLTLQINQWQPYQSDNNTLTKEEALLNIIRYLGRQNSETLMASTRIMIAPGYKFRIVDAIITNFHQPQSTLLLLVSAFVGEDWKRIYEHALQNDYRFLSYGDSSLLMRE